MKTDALYLNLFEVSPTLALHLAGYDTARASEYTCHSEELKKTFRVDAVLTPPTPDLPLIVAEIQFQPSHEIYDRLVASYAIERLYKSSEYSDMRMVLFFASRLVDMGAGVWQSLVRDKVLQVVYLDEITEQLASSAFASTEERLCFDLVRLTVSPAAEEYDRGIAHDFGHHLSLVGDSERHAMFKQFFVNLYLSKYKHLTIEEIQAMIDTTEIFDDIGESRAVQEYAEIQVQKAVEQALIQGRLESALAMLAADIPLEQVANILHLPIAAIESARQSTTA
jgi:predicted transposase/invertase (TIGR01784 family)